MGQTLRLGQTLRQARRAGEALLVLYLTLGDPVTSGPPDLGPVLAEAGVDVLEVGIPTPGARPAGAAIGASFARARARAPDDLWAGLGELRRAVPNVPVVTLIYPATIVDLGWAELLRQCHRAGIDGMVLTRPRTEDLVRVSSSGLTAIPLIPPSLGPRDVRRMEDAGAVLTYRSLAERTGEPLDPRSAELLAARLAVESSTPFLVGFGIRGEREIRALSPHVSGVVIGSEFLRLIAPLDPVERPARAAELARRWKAATRPEVTRPEVTRPEVTRPEV